MKKLLVLLLFVASQFGLATSIRDVRLELTLEPTPFVESYRTVTRIMVYGDGEVVGFSCPSLRPTDRTGGQRCSAKVIDTLSVSRVKRINRLIEQADRAEIVYPDPGGIHCLAIPTESFHYSGDNGDVLLKTGSRPCGSTTYRDAISAETLVQMLDRFNEKFQSQR